MLNETSSIPDGLLHVQASGLHAVLGGPTLLHLEGRRPEPLFLAVLLHGNEPAGFEAVQELLRRYSGRELPRSLSILFGNVAAARTGARYLPGQADYNRVWRGQGRVEHDLARNVIESMRARNVFACVDIHNNTGLNPHYAIVNDLCGANLRLASLYSRTVVYSTEPDTTCSVAFSPLCPALTVECGLPGSRLGVEQVREFVEGCLQLSRVSSSPVRGQDIDLFHAVAIVRISAHDSFGFDGDDVDIRLLPGLDHLNFRELEPGTALARIRAGSTACLKVTGDHGRDVTEEFLHCDPGGEVRLRKTVMPAMLTTAEDIIRMDCLCYLMERLALPAPLQTRDCQG